MSYGLDRATRILNLGTSMAQFGTWADQSIDRNKTQAKEKERDDYLMQYTTGGLGLDADISSPAQLEARQAYQKNTMSDALFSDFQDARVETQEKKQFQQGMIEQIRQGPVFLGKINYSQFKSPEELSWFTELVTGLADSEGHTQKLNQQRREIHAQRYKEFTAESRQAETWLRSGDPRARAMAVQVVEKWSNILNMPTKYEPTGDGSFRVHKLDNDARFKPTAKIVSVEEVIADMARMSDKNFIEEQIAMTELIKMENAKSEKDPTMLQDGNGNIFSAVIRVDTDDVNSNEVVLFQQDVGYKGTYPNMDAIWGLGLVSQDPSSSAIEDRHKVAQTAGEYTDQGKTKAETAKIWGEVQGGGGGAPRITKDHLTATRRTINDQVGWLQDGKGNSLAALLFPNPDQDAPPAPNAVRMLEEIVNDPERSERERRIAYDTLRAVDDYMRMYQMYLHPGAVRNEGQAHVQGNVAVGLVHGRAQGHGLPDAGAGAVREPPLQGDADARDEQPPVALLRPGKLTTFKNGQTWTLDQTGNPVRVK